MSDRAGRFLTNTLAGEAVRAFIPSKLPPQPPLDLSRLIGRIERANQALGRLDGITSVLPSTMLFVYMYVRKEAVLSSQIEGTQSSLSDLLMSETEDDPAAPMDDLIEVSNYIRALNHGLNRIKEDNFPLSLRLIREMHGLLLSSGRGTSQQPGEFRTSQNWIGGTRPGNASFVPPPPDQVPACLSDLELFLHDRSTYPVLLRAALAHVQFETIHPFLDGNGRLGRLLITLMLCAEGTLKQPILYLSLYFKTHRARYYELLQRVREEGDWEGWLEFFLDGVAETSEQACDTANKLQLLFDQDHDRIMTLKRAASSTLRVHGALQRSPINSVALLAKSLQTSQPTVQKSLHSMIKLGIVREITGRKRGRLYQYQRYLEILSEGTEPLA